MTTFACCHCGVVLKTLPAPTDRDVVIADVCTYCRDQTYRSIREAEKNYRSIREAEEKICAID